MLDRFRLAAAMRTINTEADKDLARALSDQLWPILEGQQHAAVYLALAGVLGGVATAAEDPEAFALAVGAIAAMHMPERAEGVLQ